MKFPLLFSQRPPSPPPALRYLAASLYALFVQGAGAQQANPPAQTLAPVVVTGESAGKTPGLPLDEISSTGSRLGLKLRETPASVTVVDREVIEARGAQNTQETLAGVPGMTAASPPGSAGSVFYRGFSGASLTQLFNGIGTHYDAISARPVDSWIYERVEAIGGPSTYLFGAGAVGGSVNYVTKAARCDGDFVEGRLRLGAFGLADVAAGFNQRLGSGEGVQHFFRLDANRSHSGTGIDDEKRNALNLAASLLTDFSPQWSHLLALEAQDEKVDRPYWGTPLMNPIGGAGRIDPGTRSKNYNARDGFYGQKVLWLRSELSWKPAPQTTVKNTLYHYDALRDWRNVETYAFNASNTAVNRSNTLLQRHDQQITGDRIEASHKGSWAGHDMDWSAGLEFSYNRQTRFPLSLSTQVDSLDPYHFSTGSFWSVPGMQPGFNPDRINTVRTVAVFAENRTRLAPAWSIITGIRHDRVTITGANQRTVTPSNPAYFRNVYRPTTGRLGLMYELTPQANVYVQYSTAADPPSGILATAAYSQVRDFDLTTGRQWEIGGKFSFAEGRGAATLAAYRITRRNLSMADPDQPLNSLPIGQQSSQGAEAALSWRITPTVSLAGNLAVSQARYDDFVENLGGQAVSRAGKRPVNIPATVANLWLNWQLTPEVRLGLDARHVSKRYANTANTLWDEPYTLWGASLDWRIHRHARLTLRGRNLSDTTYAAYASRSNFHLGPPRAFDLTLQADF